MTKYVFEANGKVVTVEAEDPIAAMAQANQQFVLSQGAWMSSVAIPQKYTWTKGNFFD